MEMDTKVEVSPDLDAMLETQFPVVRARIDGTLLQSSGCGVRYVLAANGLWREVKTPWLFALLPIATRSDIRVPAGALETTVSLACGSPPRKLWVAFKAHAVAAMPNESAGAFVWNEKTLTWRFAPRIPRRATPSHIEYTEVQICEDEHLVVDLHSHARHEAFFSVEDNKDDHGSIKLAAVVGNIDAQATLVCRLNVIDQRLSIELDANGTLKVNY